jgi:parvulin-like peptidyl-prolyl isomerase
MSIPSLSTRRWLWASVRFPIRSWAKKGYTVIHRIEEIASAHILVMYKGARSAPGGLKRSKAQAQKRAEKYAKLAKAGKEPFFVLAGRYSDSPSKVGGGVIIPLSEGKVPGLDKYFEALSKLEANEVSDVVETPYGFHVIKRLKLEEILVRHVLIRHKKAKNAGDTKRKPAEAKALARKIAKQAKEGADFKELAKKHSEDKAVELSSGNHGGLLPPFARGEMVTRFWQFAFALDVGKVSDVVETPFGFHVIKRVR